MEVQLKQFSHFGIPRPRAELPSSRQPLEARPPQPITACRDSTGANHNVAGESASIAGPSLQTPHHRRGQNFEWITHVSHRRHIFDRLRVAVRSVWPGSSMLQTSTVASSPRHSPSRPAPPLQLPARTHPIPVLKPPPVAQLPHELAHQGKDGDAFSSVVQRSPLPGGLPSAHSPR